MSRSSDGELVRYMGGRNVEADCVKSLIICVS